MLFRPLSFILYSKANLFILWNFWGSQGHFNLLFHFFYFFSLPCSFYVILYLSSKYDLTKQVNLIYLTLVHTNYQTKAITTEYYNGPFGKFDLLWNCYYPPSQLLLLPTGVRIIFQKCPFDRYFFFTPLMTTEIWFPLIVYNKVIF